MRNESPTIVIVAILANAVVAVAKIAAALATGSSAMASEAIHSIVDTGNEGLMLVGIKRSRKPADDAHPFGHGHELYFWTMLVAVVLLGVGGGVTIVEGASRIMNPVPLGDPRWSYVVLGFAAIFEGTSWAFSYRGLRKALPDKSILGAIHASKDPTVFTVLLEDSAALCGLAIAFGGTFLAHRFHNDFFDGLASILIGLVLVGAASVLLFETRGLLIGESVDAATIARIRSIAQAEGDVVGAARILTMYLGPAEILLNLDLHFRPGISGGELARAIERVDAAIKSACPHVKRIFIEAQVLETLKT